MRRCRLSRRGIALALLAPLVPAAARAQRVEGPVVIIIPYTPGTGPDILARLASPVLQAQTGQAVVVDNRPGASGLIGTQAVARAAPDGRMLMLQPNTFVMNASLFRQVPYNPVGGFTPIALLTRGDLALVVNPQVPAPDAQAFAALARGRPGALDYASPGNGTPQHLGMALFAQHAGVTMTHIPYRGSAPAIQDLIAGRVAAMFLPVHTALPLAQGGQIRMLGLGGETRAASAPDLPTLTEAGFPGVQADLWYGLLGPAGLPDSLVERLNSICNAWLADPGTAEALRAQGMVPTPTTPAGFAALVARDHARWAQVIRDNGITAD
ncbi:Bug family tripartite tricarboxylate transporter substrate binding protein [Plastoroseomonas hellenica]|uniref:Bug family tripartite tricarboxylate transporter substrate binding protein n=1 Tax=Plastoroseomonas hellenica TaxID=2687306 RepID=UPI001BA67E0F|nr:tripartite tricarboxylate transporter substrate binding protein [Plastoroseomonas hellenica]MBR0645412.1 tripartite tricarboxylate transporter substrate binding protein [Plastoroseomonas hellenica]